MKSMILFSILVLAAGFTFAQEPDWRIMGKGVTTDNCAIGCPCILGEPPTNGRCQYTGIMLIEKGRYGDVNLDNVKIAVGGAFGKSKEMSVNESDWVTYYIDASATDQQKDALHKILESPTFSGMGKPNDIKEVPITITGIEDFGKVGKTYGGTIGDVAKIEITPVSGALQGQPIVIENSADPLFDWVALGKSSNSYYKDAGMNWTFESTSGESGHFYLKKGGVSAMDQMEHHMDMEKH